jgi:putative flippase GtrA
MSDIIIKFLRFGIVGASGVLVDFSFTYLLKEKLKLNKYLANSAGFIIAATSNYILNRIWTFSSHHEISTEYFTFVAVSLVGLGLNNLTIWVLNGKFKVNFYFSKLIAIGVATFWNFFINYYYTFN